MAKRTSLIAYQVKPGSRSVKKVPFVELMSGRVQGVVSSGSDVQRVYVSFFESGSGNFYCSTNNNRPCGGLGGRPCKHIVLMIDEAIIQFGAAAVIGYLGIEGDPESLKKGHAIVGAIHKGSQTKETAGVVFSRFLNYLRFCKLEAKPGFTMEMDWFQQ